MSEQIAIARYAASTRARAFAVHILTASGGGLALLALFEAVREHWAGMFGWLGAALFVDAIDGPIARKLNVTEVLPNWSGDVLDLVIDFVTYVFVPAYAISASGLLLTITGPVIGVAIVTSGALYFADRRMKVQDNHFRGFPALWNAAAFYLFLLKPPAAVATIALALLVILTFVPFNVLHPVRTRRLRTVNLSLIALGSVLSIAALVCNFDVLPIVKIVLCVIALYVLVSDLVFRAVSRVNS